MRIGIDARTILNPDRGDAIGVGHYTYQLIRHLLDLDRKNEYVLFFDFRVREKDVKKFTRTNVKIKFYPFSDYKKYLPVAYNEILGTATLVKEGLDLIHSTSPMSRIPSGYRGKTVVTIHDMAPYKVPEVFPRLYRAKVRTVTSLMAGKAGKIIAVSESVKNDLKNILHIPEEKIRVIYSGFDRRILENPEISRENFLKKYKLRPEEKYILFLGTLEPVKNLTRLLEAFRIFKNQNRKNHKLMIAGKRGWLATEYKQMIRDWGLENEVIFTGYVAGDDLAPLFRNAEFFVMPSLYEGFGTTVLEALATGTPSIVSRVSSLPEVAGDAAVFVNPMDVNEIARAMTRLSEDENLKKELKEKGKIQAEKFNWEKCAEETLALYEKLSAVK